MYESQSTLYSKWWTILPFFGMKSDHNFSRTVTWLSRWRLRREYTYTGADTGFGVGEFLLLGRKSSHPNITEKRQYDYTIHKFGTLKINVYTPGAYTCSGTYHNIFFIFLKKNFIFLFFSYHNILISFVKLDDWKFFVIVRFNTISSNIFRILLYHICNDRRCQTMCAFQVQMG